MSVTYYIDMMYDVSLILGLSLSRHDDIACGLTNYNILMYIKFSLSLLMLFRGLIHSQMDAEYKEDAALTCSSAIHLAKNKVPAQLVEVLKIQVLKPFYYLHLL